MKNIKYSFLAGILIGFGVIINLQATPPILGAFLFSFGLITIINMQLNLFTGKIGYITKNNIPFLLLMLICNFIGVALTVTLYAIANPSIINLIINVTTIKFSKSFIELFINGFFCGMLIHLAVKNKNIVITIMAIIIFILIGAEHCIADFPFLLFNFSFINSLKLLNIIIGNSLGAILIERLSNE